jgi:hypothetical protein
MMDDRRVPSPPTGESRRDVVKKMAYAAPFVLSLAASPAFASSGSCGCPHRSAHSSTRSNNQQLINN